MEPIDPNSSPDLHDSTSLWATNPDVFSTVVEGDTVLMNTETGKYLFMNPTGSAIWNQLDQPRACAEIVDALVVEFEVDKAMCTAEVHAFLRRLEDARMVERQTSQPNAKLCSQ